MATGWRRCRCRVGRRPLCGNRLHAVRGSPGGNVLKVDPMTDNEGTPAVAAGNSRRVLVNTFKMHKATKVFNEGQRVWVQMTTGSLAARVIGKYRNRFRWVE